MQRVTKLLGSRGSASKQVEDFGKSSSPNQADTGDPVPKDPKTIRHGLYVYCIVPSDSPREYGRIGVGTGSLVYAIPFKDLAAVVSEFAGDSFQKNDANVLAHQRVVQRIFDQVPGIPVKFGTIRENQEDVRNVLEEGYSDFEKELSELTPKEGSAIESAAPTDVIGQILSQSAASAVRIRQMTDALDQAKRGEYEKGADRLSEGIAKQLLEFLAKAPPGSYQTSEAPGAAITAHAQEVEKRLGNLAEEVTGLRRDLSAQTTPDASFVAAVTAETQKIREALGDLRNLYTDNAASIGFQLGSLATGFEKLRVAYTENTATLERTVRGAVTEAIPASIEQALAKQTRVPVDTTSLERTMRETIIEAIPASIEQALAKQARVPVSYARRPAIEEAPEYTWCVGCRNTIALTDRFCDHCGWPTALTQGPEIS
jgi:hypothetical protein